MFGVNYEELLFRVPIINLDNIFSKCKCI